MPGAACRSSIVSNKGTGLQRARNVAVRFLAEQADFLGEYHDLQHIACALRHADQIAGDAIHAEFLLCARKSYGRHPSTSRVPSEYAKYGEVSGRGSFNNVMKQIRSSRLRTSDA